MWRLAATSLNRSCGPHVGDMRRDLQRNAGLVFSPLRLAPFVPLAAGRRAGPTARPHLPPISLGGWQDRLAVHALLDTWPSWRAAPSASTPDMISTQNSFPWAAAPSQRRNSDCRGGPRGSLSSAPAPNAQPDFGQWQSSAGRAHRSKDLRNSPNCLRFESSWLARPARCSRQNGYARNELADFDPCVCVWPRNRPHVAPFKSRLGEHPAKSGIAHDLAEVGPKVVEYDPTWPDAVDSGPIWDEFGRCRSTSSHIWSIPGRRQKPHRSKSLARSRPGSAELQPSEARSLGQI